MKIIATLLRSMQLFAQRAHNVIQCSTFFQDHEFLGTLYPAYDGEYDMVVERMIGLGQQPDIATITKEACDLACMHSATTDTKELLRYLLRNEEHLCRLIKAEVPKSSDGTQNMLQGIADNSESRQYKLKQRLA